MCGIVGILGTEPVAGALVDALKRLEYRGYDSAGVATLEGGHLTRRRAEGKLRNLETRLSKEPLGGNIGIGHTRWATHGAPNETNAHPHATDKLAAKGLDLIVANDVTQAGAGFGSEHNAAIILSRTGTQHAFDLRPKSQLAHDILSTIVEFAKKKPRKATPVSM